MRTITALHWSEQRLCSHPDVGQLVRFRFVDGTEQVTRACEHCGKRTGLWLPFADHPDRAEYPLLVSHPDPCDCHPTKLEQAITTPARPSRRVEYDEYLHSPEWQERRQYFLARAMYRCQLCKRPGPQGRGLNVHHSDYSRLGAELEIDVIVLCRNCHARHHGVIPTPEAA